MHAINYFMTYAKKPQSLIHHLFVRKFCYSNYHSSEIQAVIIKRSEKFLEAGFPGVGNFSRQMNADERRCFCTSLFLGKAIFVLFP